ncbi:hypothetical protein PG997_008155 [Apiospora hydei]|uniref:Cytochrome P450 n=1 Tax=Apiospora hydei TaxID=1337664 RepID=A0ABR1WA88_9PEZI
MRLMGSTEIAEDPIELKRTLSIFQQFERSGVSSFVLPWLITSTHARRIFIGIKLYRVLSKAIHERQMSGKRENDALQYLLGREPNLRILSSAVWAGILTAGAVASWMPVLLASNVAWKRECQREVVDVVARHRKCPFQSSCVVLKSLGLEVWESKFPMLNNCLHETIRLVVPGTMFRKNTSGTDIPIGNTGTVIPNGSFAAFHVDNVHMNPLLYEEPLQFNPGRYSQEYDSRTNEPHAYVDWGSGCHPCVGTKIARLEITMFMAYFISHFDFEVSNEHGYPTHEAPPLPDRNRHKAEKPKVPIYLRCRYKEM